MQRNARAVHADFYRSQRSDPKAQDEVLMIALAHIQETTMRITRYEVTFTRDFVLKGYDDVIPAGTYEIRAEDARLPTVLSTGWRRVETVMRLPALGVDSGVESVITVDSDDLQNALKRDAIPSMN